MHSLSIATLWLQAGSGGSFGGGGGAGGGGGDGDGIFWILYWLLRLAIVYPLLGVPLLLLAVVVVVIGARKGRSLQQTHTIRRAQPQRYAHNSALAADRLRGLDADFNAARFLARVRAAFDKAQAAWCNQALEPLRPFVSDGVFERFSLQIEEQVQDGWRQGLDGLRVGTLSLLHMESGQHFDTLSVRIPFSARIDKRERSSGKSLSGSRLPTEDFVEAWSFVRRRGARSINGAGLMEGQCPNCGAPLEHNQSARCGQCECQVRSGQFDWVLAEITQFSEWRAENEAQILGLVAYLESDQGFNVQLLEDRASLAFWRLCAAQRSGRIEPLTRVAKPALCASYVAALMPDANGARTTTGDCAVGSVRTLGLLAGENEDRAVVEIVWDGRSLRISREGTRTLAPQRHLRRTLFVFARKSGAKTRVDDSLSTATCRNCGAHDAGGTQADCPYCGIARSGNDSMWLLAQIQERAAAAELLEELAKLRNQALPLLRAPSTESAAGLLTWAAALARSDGEIDERERRGIRAIAARLSVLPQRVEELLTDDLSGSGPQPADRDEARVWFYSLAELALADGALSKAERGFLTHAAARMGIAYRDSEAALKAARSKLYAASREARRSAGARD